MKIRIPRNDRNGVANFWTPKENSLLEDLPFSYDDAAISTIKNIDVLWIS